MSTTSTGEAAACHSLPGSIDILNTVVTAKDRVALTTRSTSSFLSLPLEIRNMVYTEDFLLISANQDGTFHFTYDVCHHPQLACITEAIQVHFICSLLALCRQIKQEVRSLFWSTMTFKSACFDSRLLQTSARLVQILPDLQHHSLVAPLRSVHHIQLDFVYHVPTLFVFLKFWKLARFGSNKLELKLSWHQNPSDTRPLQHGPMSTSVSCEQSLVIKFYHKIRARQRELEEGNVSLELTKEKLEWLAELNS